MSKDNISYAEALEDSKNGNLENLQTFKDKKSGIEFRIPEDFRTDENGTIYKMTKDGLLRISPHFIGITGIIHNLDNDTEKLKIELVKGDTVKEGIFSKSQIYSNPIELSNFGVSVNAINSRHLIKYLSELEIENEDIIPTIKAVSKLGWREGKLIPFCEDTDIEVDIDYKLQKWVNAYSEKGTLKEWIERIKPFRENNIFRCIMSASFAAPLLKLLR